MHEKGYGVRFLVMFEVSDMVSVRARVKVRVKVILL
jgi:hypothetical protein